jgi:hypothetical protein
MADTKHQLAQPSRDLLTSAARWVDTVSKVVAGIAIALYACGFLIVSLYHAKFGFVGTNPFRPRVLAAGAWFFFFTAIPVWFAAGLRTVRWEEIVKWAFVFWTAFYMTATQLGYFFEFSPYPPSIAHIKWSLPLSAVLFAAATVSSYLAFIKKVPRWVASVISVTVTLYWATGPVWRWVTDSRVDTTTLALLFFATALLVKYEIQPHPNRYLGDLGTWTMPLGLLFVLLLIFSRGLYPNLKASWGGGTPTIVTVYFTKDSLLDPTKSAQAQLIEEYDEGFYIVGPKESKAIFIPRSAVALIYFSDKTADSGLLQGGIK